MSEITIRPTAKFLKAGTVGIALVFLAIEIAYFVIPSWREEEILKPLPLVAVLLFLWPGVKWLRRLSIKGVVSGDRLYYQTGMASKSTRTIQISKLQDVRVDQSLPQRLFHVGDLSLETSGEASRLTIHNVDDPQAIADDLMNRAQKGAATS